MTGEAIRQAATAFGGGRKHGRDPSICWIPLAFWVRVSHWSCGDPRTSDSDGSCQFSWQDVFSMVSIHFALALLFGVILGALAVVGSRATELPPGLLPSLTTVAVGWWIHYTIRRQAELERVHLSYVSELSKRIDHLASLCLETYLSLATTPQSSLLSGALSSNKGITELRKLANELHMLTSILDGSRGSRCLSVHSSDHVFRIQDSPHWSRAT